MSAMRPFVLRLPAEALARGRGRARAEGKPLAAWLRDVLAWYLVDWLPAHRHLAEGACLVTIAPNRRLGLSKRLLDPLAIHPGDRVLVRTVGRALILTKSGARSRPRRAGRKGVAGR